MLPSIRKTSCYGLPLIMDDVQQIMRLPEAYKREAFRRLLSYAARQSDPAEGARLMCNICCIFAAAATGAPWGRPGWPSDLSLPGRFPQSSPMPEPLVRRGAFCP
ncbi:hypothetical protein [uncultured Desulfovibrio sp.]|uniref:hypothetical protein n=1 Tax=Desulfovibrio legallii TaxID=571438 RepID=UPI0025926568|nr:hypothetical protein [uncultured Desulfovibrio sp.]